MSNETVFADAIEAIYNAALEPGSWPAAMARAVDAVGANGACFCTADLADQRIVMLPIGVDPRMAIDYTRHYARIDPLIPAILTAEPGRAYSDLMIMPRREMERTETYRDWAVPNGIRAAAGVVLQHDSERVVTLAVTRERRDDEFEPDTLRRLERLAVHVRRALAIQQRLGAADSRAAALDRIGDGVLLVDRRARVLYANRAAEDVLADSGALRTEHGVLAGRRPADTAALHALIAGGGTMRLARVGRAPLAIVAVPRTAEQSPLAGEQPAAFVFVSDPERQAMPSTERLRTLFGLTPMQAAFAQEIARGDGIDATAARLGISRATARAHLAAVFDKTKTTRQAELVRVLLRCAPDFRQD